MSQHRYPSATPIMVVLLALGGALGLRADPDFEGIVRQYVRDHAPAVRVPIRAGATG